MKLPQTRLRLKLKSGTLSKLEKEAFLNTTKAKPLATSTSTKTLGAEIISKPILGHQIHAMNRERRALRRLRDVSHLQQTPMVSPSFKPLDAPTSPVDTPDEVKDVPVLKPTARKKRSYPARSLQITRASKLGIRDPWLSTANRNALKRRLAGLPARRPLRTEGTITDLRSILGLGDQIRQPYTLLAMDTEFVQHPGHKLVTEIGLTTLRVDDIVGIEPGPYARNWVRKMEHCHIHIRRPLTNRALRPPVFAQTQTLSTKETKVLLEKFFRSLAGGQDVGNVALVGHAIMGDVVAILEDPDLRIDIREIGGDLVNMDRIFDTHILGEDAVHQGADFDRLQLGSMLHFIGSDPIYYKTGRKGLQALKGLHNASNDAAYSMMNLLLLAIRWNELIANALGSRRRIKKDRWDSRGAMMAELAEWRKLSGMQNSPTDGRGLPEDDWRSARSRWKFVRKDPPEESRPQGWFAWLFGRLRAS